MSPLTRKSYTGNPGKTEGFAEVKDILNDRNLYLTHKELKNKYTILEQPLLTF